MRKRLPLTKPGNQSGEKKRKSAISITNWQSFCFSQWTTVPSLFASACSMMVWDSVMNFRNRNHWTTSLSRKNIPNLPWQATISHTGYRAITTLKSTTTPSPVYRKSEVWCNRRSLQILLKPHFHRQVYRRHWWWKQMMVYTSICTKPLWLIILVCTSIWTTKTWYSNPGWHRMQKGIKVTCRLRATLRGVRSSSVMMHVTFSPPASPSTWTNLVRLQTPPPGLNRWNI